MKSASRGDVARGKNFQLLVLLFGFCMVECIYWVGWCFSLYFCSHKVL